MSVVARGVCVATVGGMRSTGVVSDDVRVLRDGGVVGVGQVCGQSCVDVGYVSVFGLRWWG